MQALAQEKPGTTAAPSLEEAQLKGISRTVAEIHWLLLILVLIFMVFGEYDKDAEPAISAGGFFYAAFILSFRYAFFLKRESRTKIAVETWAMVAFITWTLANTGGLGSPLLNSYLLPIITAALTLGKFATIAEVGMVAACQVWLGGNISYSLLFSLSFIGSLAAQMAPVLLVAYIVTLFSTDIHYGLNRAKLLSETDELTGALNKRGFALTSARLFALAERHQRPASILMFDSDNLKPVNDTHGHEAGDALLQHLTRVIQGGLRTSDVLSRFGGDEFVAMLPETPVEGAVHVAERIRQAMADSPLHVGTTQVRCTVSIGVAAYPKHGATLDQVLECGDRAMYAAKKGGRNRVVSFDDLSPEEAAVDEATRRALPRATATEAEGKS